MELPTPFGLSPQNVPLKKFLIIFTKKTFSEKVSYIFSKKTLLFSGNETFLYFLKKSFSYILVNVYSEPWYIQNPGIFRTRRIVRTLVYSECETYLEHCQTSTIKCFAKNSHLAHFLVFWETELFYFFRNGTF